TCPTVPNSVLCTRTHITVFIPTAKVCVKNACCPRRDCTNPSSFGDFPPLLLLNVRANGVTGPDLPLIVRPVYPRLLNSCDLILGPWKGQDCQVLANHVDGTRVSNSDPAKVGETITLYAVGFGLNGEIPLAGGVEFAPYRDVIFYYSYPID